jgi:hypothetical protein
MPDCIGHHEPGHPECDGAPCRWAAGCGVYQINAQVRAATLGTDAIGYIELEKKMLPKAALRAVVIELLRAKPIVRNERDPRHKAGLRRFLEAFEAADPGVALHGNRRVADHGELVWSGAGSKREPVTYVVKIRGASYDLPLFRYHLGKKSRVEPSIEMRAPVRAVLAAFPAIEYAAKRWTGVGWRRRQVPKFRVGATAVGVFSERVEDFGRLCAALLREGHLPGVSVSMNRVKATEEAKTWRHFAR